MADLQKLQFNNRTILTPSRDSFVAFVESVPPTPQFPSDMDFIYLANDFDGTKIVNKVTNSTFGNYLAAGTINKNGSGSSAYLTNGLSDNNYLYKTLSTAELNKFKAVNNTYTYFVRVQQDTTNMGGIISFRSNTGTLYIYMIRANNKQLQIHTETGYDCGSNFVLTEDKVFKVVVNGSSFKAINLNNNAEYSLTYSTNRGMGDQLLSFTAYKGAHSEAKLSRFYAIAGIARATTTEEDAQIKAYLLSQGV